jgi:aminoglycoside phosphotransferase family enzyme
MPPKQHHQPRIIQKRGALTMENQNPIIEALKKPQTYPKNPGQIQLVQTHISYVFLTQNTVYKVKKSVNFGFLDFRTLEKRKFFCEKELQLNRRLCPDMYLQVVPITNQNGTYKIGGTGEPVEFALEMKRIPQDKIMTKLLEENKVDTKLVGEIAKIIADFHAKAETSPSINEIGSFATVKTNWDENFQQTRNVIGVTISQQDFEALEGKIGNFMQQNKALFEKRIAEGRIRDCHGDIHSENIFITDKIYIFDAIEFNERFRYSDVAADVAFLAMDLDFKNRTDLSDHFIEKYVEYSSDGELPKLLPFYKCYRAYVRGKVIGFKLVDPNVPAAEKQACTQLAQAYFKLAVNYIQEL